MASEEYRKELKQADAEKGGPAGWGGPEVTELREVKWAKLLSRLMKSAGKTRKEARTDPESAEWKVQIARGLRASSTATNRWIAEHLHLGHPTRVCNLIRSDR